MKKFTDLMSPSSLGVIFFVVYAGLVLLFHPTAWELGLFFVVDCILVAPGTYWLGRTLVKKHPEAALYFPAVNEEKIAKLSVDEKTVLFQSLIHLPERRAKPFVLGSLVKIMIPGLVVAFVWDHGQPAWAAFAKFMLFETMVFTWMYGVIFMDMHDFVTRKIAEFHRAYDWTEVFLNAELPPVKARILSPENLALTAIPFWALALAVMVIISNQSTSAWALGRDMLFVGITMSVLVFHLYRVNRGYFERCLQEIFLTFEQLDFGDATSVMPLHSHPVLARFGKTFNALSLRLKSRERDLSELLSVETERSRFRALGEISGLIAHDMAGPLQVIQYCTEALYEKCKNSEDRLLLGRLYANLDRSIDLVNSLRAYLKNPDHGAEESSFFEAHTYVVTLISTQYRGQLSLGEIDISVDPSLKSLRLMITRLDLTHILYNVYKNAIDNMLQNPSASGPGTLRIYRDTPADDAGMINIAIEDSGTGLTVDSFEELTRTDTLHLKPGAYRRGLGLKLVRRLIDSYKGSLNVGTPPEHGGTKLILRLSMVQERVANSQPKIAASSEETAAENHVSV